MIDKKALHDDLIKAFINYQYNLDNPFQDGIDTDYKKQQSFLDDYLFHNKVCQLTAGVMLIVSKHIDNTTVI